MLALRAAVVKNEEHTEKLRQFAGALHMQSDATVCHNVGRSIAPGISRLASLKRLFYSVAYQLT